MFERFTERARQSVVCAQEEARALLHNYIGTEHLLLGLLRVEDGAAARVLGSLDVTIEEVRVQVARIIGYGDEAMSGQIPFTPRAKKVLELSLREALSLGHNYIGTEHVLLGVARENGGVAARILLEFDVDADAIRERVMRTLSTRAVRPPPEPGSRSRSLAVPRRPRWEYRVEDWGAAEAPARQAALSQLGVEGWQLVAVVPSGETSQWIFHRPIFELPRASRPARPRWTASLFGGASEDPDAPLTVEQLLAGIAAVKEEAQARDEQDRAQAIGELEERLTAILGLLADVVKPAQGAAPTAMTVDGLIAALASAKEDQIAGSDFACAAATRDLERNLRGLLADVRNAVTAGSPPDEPS